MIHVRKYRDEVKFDKPGRWCLFNKDSYRDKFGTSCLGTYLHLQDTMKGK